MTKAKTYLLDTSALMTLIEGEHGADRVSYLLKHEHIFIAAPSLCEVMYITLQERDEQEADIRYAMLLQSGAHILRQMSESVVLNAAHFKAKFRLSFADALIAAFAVDQSATLVHKDPEMDALIDSLALERLPSKKSRA